MKKIILKNEFIESTDVINILGLKSRQSLYYWVSKKVLTPIKIGSRIRLFEAKQVKRLKKDWSKKND